MRKVKRTQSRQVVDYETKERVASLEKQIAKMSHSGGKDVASVGYKVCEECQEIGHNSDGCQANMGKSEEEVNQIYGDRKQYDLNSNTYHPGLRNHPNLSMGMQLIR